MASTTLNQRLVAPGSSTSSAQNQQTDECREWSWDAVKTWWNPSCNDGCKKAETDLLHHFIDDELYEYQSRNVPINYDPEPLSVKQQKLKRSQSFIHNIFSKPLNLLNDTASKSTSSLKENVEYIHTLSFRVRSHQLKELNESKIDINKSFNPPPVDQAQVEKIRARQGTKSGQDLDEYFGGKDHLPTYPQLRSELHSMSQSPKVSQKKMAPIVLCHGYGCASGIFIPSIPTIFETLLSSVSVEQSPVIHCIDWLGNGMSSRPEFLCADTKEAEDWHTESLEAWRKSMGIDKMILSGHSMGGYACCVYAMKYPQNVEHLILISPAGIPVKPKDFENDYSWKVRQLFKVASGIYNMNFTPHGLVRFIGPKGYGMIQKTVERRLAKLSDDDPLKQMLVPYLYNVIAQKGSGEYALHKILQPAIIFAWHPLALRIGELKQYQRGIDDGNRNEDNDMKYDENEGNKVKNSNLRINFIYGEVDWMGAGNAAKLMKESVIKCNVHISPGVGHQLILENANGFGLLFGGIVAKGQILSSKK